VLQFETVVIQPPAMGDPMNRAVLVDPYGATFGIANG
jgi:hypothetical protein